MTFRLDKPVVGIALPVSSALLMNLDLCGHNEALNPLGPNRCSTNADCEGARTCSSFGWCMGSTYCIPLSNGPTGEKEAFGINNTGTIDIK